MFTNDMPKNIIIINSKNKIDQLLLDLFEELKHKGHNFFILSDEKHADYKAKKVYLGPELGKTISSLIFILTLPFLLIPAIFYLTHYKIKKKADLIICFNINEKLIFTPAAKIIGLKIIWLELPEVNYKKLPLLIRILLKQSAKWPEKIVFNNLTKDLIKAFGFKENNIKIVKPGIKLKQHKHQDTIFNKLAQAERKPFKRKYFTIGTIVNLDYKQNLKAILQAVKICVTVIPDLQVIIAGDGQERKNLAWLAKRLGIGNLVWFVGEQKYLKKWLDSFDIFIVASEIICLTDMRICLEAMAAGLPIIAPNQLGLDEIIKDNKTGKLIKIKDSEELAREIIGLQQNNTMRLRLSKGGIEQINKNFTMDNFIKQFEEAVNS